MKKLKSDTEVIRQIFQHIDAGTTDLGESDWKEPVENYTSEKRFDAELNLLKCLPVAFAPSAALLDEGSYIARPVAGVPIIVVRDKSKQLRAFRNACRHRGKTLVEGEGKTSVFQCRYHGWTYGIDGSLQYVPHEAGFPGLDHGCHGLMPIHGVIEQGGLVYVCIEEPFDQGALGNMPQIIKDDQKIFDSSEYSQAFNWKLNIEATMEGYHIKPTHEKTFYPYGYDNLNIVETFGLNSRITFPFRRIEDLRNIAEEKRDITGKVTYVYSVFPNCTVAFLSDHISVVISEPVSPTETQYFSYRLGQFSGNETEEDIERMRRDARFVTETGLEEDNAVVAGIQDGLKSAANTHFIYGLYEKAIVHFLKNLTDLVNKAC
jgi:phenylpropionate dioxygenase-like ring-hydroxylating dioxygenase large terminal subunit